MTLFEVCVGGVAELATPIGFFFVPNESEWEYFLFLILDWKGVTHLACCTEMLGYLSLCKTTSFNFFVIYVLALPFLACLILLALHVLLFFSFHGINQN